MAESIAALLAAPGTRIVDQDMTTRGLKEPWPANPEVSLYALELDVHISSFQNCKCNLHTQKQWVHHAVSCVRNVQPTRKENSLAALLAVLGMARAQKIRMMNTPGQKDGKPVTARCHLELSHYHQDHWQTSEWC